MEKPLAVTTFSPYLLGKDAPDELYCCSFLPVYLALSRKLRNFVGVQQKCLLETNGFSFS